MIRHILTGLLSLWWLCLAMTNCHMIPATMMIPMGNNHHPHHHQLFLHHLNHQSPSSASSPSSSVLQPYNFNYLQSPLQRSAMLLSPLLKNHNINQRQARGLLSTLAGLGNVAAATSLLTNKDPDDDDGGLLSSGGSGGSGSSSNSNKPKPYAFNDVEMSAIQAMIALRNIIGELLHKVGVNIPSSIASLITRSENGVEKNISPATSLLSAADSSSSSMASQLLASATSKSNAMLLLRGLAISLPLLIPMANQIRRMSNDNGAGAGGVSAIASLPAAIQQSTSATVFPSSPAAFLPQLDPYGYDRALHRRRGKRSTETSSSSLSEPSETILLSAPTNRLLRQEEQQRIIQYLKELEELYGGNPTLTTSNSETSDSKNTNQNNMEKLSRRSLVWLRPETPNRKQIES